MHFKKSNDNQSTILHEGNVPYLTFRKLDQAGVRHGFSTRIGGVSEGMFATLNLSYNRCFIQDMQIVFHYSFMIL